MPLYFAYGSNMDVAAMAKRCPRARAIAPARLIRHRLAVMREGWLTAVRDPRAVVHGVLWDLTLADIPALDRFEGVARGLYHKAIQSVATGAGPKSALVYFGANAGPGAPSLDYIDTVLAAARRWGLPLDPLIALAPQRALRPEQARKDERTIVRTRFATPFDEER
jgi:gamma-glutamylcyclotransferase (GGCT)/AIG2-like uncharacterized protein YtfP